MLDGKGVLPAEVADLEGFQVISPDRAAFNPIENLTPDEVADGLMAMFANKDSADPFWDRAAAKLIRAGATVLQLAAAVDPTAVKFNLGSLYRVLFAADGLAEIRAVLFERPADGAALDLMPGHVRRAWDYLAVEFPALPEKTRGSISGNASIWLSAFVDNARLSSWADADEGVQIEDALDGARICVLLPEAEFGKRGRTSLHRRCTLRSRGNDGPRTDQDGDESWHPPLLRNCRNSSTERSGRRPSARPGEPSPALYAAASSDLRRT